MNKDQKLFPGDVLSDKDNNLWRVSNMTWPERLKRDTQRTVQFDLVKTGEDGILWDPSDPKKDRESQRVIDSEITKNFQIFQNAPYVISWAKKVFCDECCLLEKNDEVCKKCEFPGDAKDVCEQVFPALGDILVADNGSIFECYWIGMRDIGYQNIDDEREINWFDLDKPAIQHTQISPNMEDIRRTFIERQELIRDHFCSLCMYDCGQCKLSGLVGKPHE